MAVLPEADRADVWARLMEDASQRGDGVPNMTKVDWRSVINAVDDWVNANAVNYNAALPQPFRTNATAAQKALVLMWVVQRRYLRGL